MSESTRLTHETVPPRSREMKQKRHPARDGVIPRHPRQPMEHHLPHRLLPPPHRLGAKPASATPWTAAHLSYAKRRVGSDSVSNAWRIAMKMADSPDRSGWNRRDLSQRWSMLRSQRSIRPLHGIVVGVDGNIKRRVECGEGGRARGDAELEQDEGCEDESVVPAVSGGRARGGREQRGQELGEVREEEVGQWREEE